MRLLLTASITKVPFTTEEDGTVIAFDAAAGETYSIYPADMYRPQARAHGKSMVRKFHQIPAGQLKTSPAALRNIIQTTCILEIWPMIILIIGFAVKDCDVQNLKTLGVIYNKGEVNSVTNIKKAKAFCDSHGIVMEEATVTGVNEVQSAIDVLNTKCDAVFAPNDNMIASAMNIVGPACAKAKKPLYVGADSMVQDGGFLSVGINYENLGKKQLRLLIKF